MTVAIDGRARARHSQGQLLARSFDEGACYQAVTDRVLDVFMYAFAYECAPGIPAGSDRRLPPAAGSGDDGAVCLRPAAAGSDARRRLLAHYVDR